MRYPNIWGLRNLVDQVNKREVEVHFDEIGFVPARPEGFPSWRERVRAAWLVFAGQADATNFQTEFGYPKTKTIHVKVIVD